VTSGERRRRVAVLAAATLLTAATLASAYLLRDPEPYFRRRRSALASVVEGGVATEGAYRLQPVRLVASSGLAVELTLKWAAADSGRRLPLAVLLGGHHTGRDAVRLLRDSRGVLVAALSYPIAGDPRPDAAAFLRDVPRIRAAFLDTPPALMLALDYLRRRPEVDTTRVEAIGVSLGAPFVCIAGALDPRFTRVWAIHGSGGSYGPLEMNMRRTIRFAPARVVAAAIANVVIAGPRLDPARWVARIAPRPFVMVNAAGDERLPKRDVEALYASARPPKELVWLPGAHVHADTAVVRELAEVVLARLRAESR
jgi:dienelactone hydrolase